MSILPENHDPLDALIRADRAARPAPGLSAQSRSAIFEAAPASSGGGLSDVLTGWTDRLFRPLAAATLGLAAIAGFSAGALASGSLATDWQLEDEAAIYLAATGFDNSAILPTEEN